MMRHAALASLWLITALLGMAHGQAAVTQAPAQSAAQPTAQVSAQASAQVPAQATLCDLAPADYSVRLERMSTHGEFTLADGRLFRPLGIVMAQPVVAQRQQPLWRGRDVGFAQLSPHPDRWGRHSAWASVASSIGQDPLPLTLALLSDGMGLAEPGEVPLACRPAVLKAEAEARRAKRGIWRDAAQMAQVLVDANAPGEAAKTRMGRFMLLEGKVLRANEGRQRSFIDFGLRGSGAATAAMPRRTMAMILPQGIKLADLKGKKLRLRGILEWQAHRPYMLIETATMIEVLD